jgi:acetolactate synthase I/II/III large subunit
MRNYVDGGEAVLEAFRKLRIDYIMSSPGSEWSPVWEALARQELEHKAGPSFIESWHETVAVNMAAGYTLMTGRPQAVLLHAGVGLLQGSMGVHGAFQNEIPMLVMSGESQSLGEDPDLDIEHQWYGGLTFGGMERFVQPIAKWARSVTSPFTLYESVIRAGEMAQRIPKGPIYLNVALEHMLHDWTPPLVERDVLPAPLLQPRLAEIDKVAQFIRNAKDPVVVAENSGRDPRAFSALVELADLLAVPVTNGRSHAYANFPTDHPLYIGFANYRAVEDADLVLLVGGRAPWYPPRRRPTRGKIVAIHDNPLKADMIYQNLHVDFYLEGDMAESLALLKTAAKPTKSESSVITARRKRWVREHEKHVAELASERERASSGSSIDPIALLGALDDLMPENAIYVDETITHSALLRQFLPQRSSQCFFRGSGGLGQGIGTALGIKLAAPERPVALLVGDGSFLYNPIIQGLGASKRYGLPILIIVLNNKKYEAMRNGHLHHYPDGAAANTNLHYGVSIDGPDYAQLGTHFGFHGVRVEERGELENALASALVATKDGRTAILNVLVTR